MWWRIALVRLPTVKSWWCNVRQSVHHCGHSHWSTHTHMSIRTSHMHQRVVRCYVPLCVCVCVCASEAKLFDRHHVSMHFGWTRAVAAMAATATAVAAAKHNYVGIGVLPSSSPKRQRGPDKTANWTRFISHMWHILLPINLIKNSK